MAKTLTPRFFKMLSLQFVASVLVFLILFVLPNVLFGFHYSPGTFVSVLIIFITFKVVKYFFKKKKEPIRAYITAKDLEPKKNIV